MHRGLDYQGLHDHSPNIWTFHDFIPHPHRPGCEVNVITTECNVYYELCTFFLQKT